MNEQERRAPGVRRVPVETLVEICGRDSSVPGFEAESVEVSGRGMHVRTDYLPDVGAPLVMRFETDGGEVIVEGEVAWQEPGDDGGEFGIKFTALDSSSVQVLKRLCGPREPEPAAEPEPAPSPESPVASPVVPNIATGSRVKLHIQGLGAPMKARVCKSGKHRVDVGSSLGFLQVGRPLELEDVDAEARRSAEIDSVAVQVDPQTQVPELVVTLKYEGAGDATPEPSTVDTREPEPIRHEAMRPAGAGAAPQSRTHSPDDDPEPADDYEPQVEPQPRAFAAHGYVEAPDDISDEERDALAERLEQFAHGLGRIVKRTGSRLFSAGGHAAGSITDAAGGLKSKLQQQGLRKGARRRTAAPPRQAAGGRYALRPQAGAPRTQRATQAVRAPQSTARGKPSSAMAPARNPKRRLAMGGGALALLSVGAYFAFASPAPAPALSSSRPAAPLTEVAPASEASRAPATATPAATPNEAAPQAAAAKPEAEPSKTKGGIVADVPLFGKRPLTTEQPAPLGETEASESEASASVSDVAEFGVGDETFADKRTADAPAAPTTEAEPAKPKDVKPWGSGRLHLPIVHRLKLDGPGAALQGTQTATGFQVLIPERKALETGRAIEKRDDRIVAVKVDNSSRGAKITFKFRKDIPPYKVRFKDQHVEFFISSPEKK